MITIYNYCNDYWNSNYWGFSHFWLVYIVSYGLVALALYLISLDKVVHMVGFIKVKKERMEISAGIKFLGTIALGIFSFIIFAIATFVLVLTIDEVKAVMYVDKNLCQVAEGNIKDVSEGDSDGMETDGKNYKFRVGTETFDFDIELYYANYSLLEDTISNNETVRIYYYVNCFSDNKILKIELIEEQ